MGKHKHSKVILFSNILDEAEIHAIPKTWKNWISILWEKYGKHKHFKFIGFLNISGYYNSQNMGKVNSHNAGRLGKKKYYKITGFIKISSEAEIHTIPKNGKSEST